MVYIAENEKSGERVFYAIADETIIRKDYRLLHGSMLYGRIDAERLSPGVYTPDGIKRAIEAEIEICGAEGCSGDFRLRFLYLNDLRGRLFPSDPPFKISPKAECQPKRVRTRYRARYNLEALKEVLFPEARIKPWEKSESKE